MVSRTLALVLIQLVEVVVGAAHALAAHALADHALVVAAKPG